MKIALTGGEGFTGHHLTQAAQRAGHEVVSLQSNITDGPALAAETAGVQPDAVVHLAGIAFVGHENDRAFYDVNLFGTLNLLEALSRCASPPRCVLLASSANVYGNWGDAPIREDLPPAPVNHYAMSKLAMEHMARTYFSRLPVVIARPFNYTGPGQSTQFVIPKLIDHFRRRAPKVKLGNLHVQREYNDVRFVCDAYLRLLERASAGCIYNVCTGVTHDFSAVLAALHRLTGHDIEIEVDPSLVRPNEVHRLCGDPTRLRQAVGPVPEYSLDDTLRWMLE